MTYSLSTGLFLIAAPIQAFSLLQSLHLIPSSAVPSAMTLMFPTSLFASNYESGLFNATMNNGKAVAKAVSRLLLSPLSLAWAHDCVRHRLESKIYRIIRRTVPKPDRPDHISNQAAHEGDLDDSQIPGLAVGRQKDGNNESAAGLCEEIKKEIRSLFQWLRNTFRFSARVRSTPTLSLPFSVEGALRIRSQQLQRQYLRGSGRPSDEERIRELQIAAVRRAFEERELSGPDDIEDWIHHGLDDLDTSSTATPEPEDFFNPDEMSLPEALTRLNLSSTTQGGLSRNSTSPANSSRDTQEGAVMEPISRANTFLSDVTRSPPLTPPSLRATLIHEDAETVTMQLETATQAANQHQLPHTAIPPPPPPPEVRDVAFEDAVQHVESAVQRTRAAVTEAVRQIADEEVDSEAVTLEAETALRDAEQSVREAARIGGVNLRTTNPRGDQADDLNSQTAPEARGDGDRPQTGPYFLNEDTSQAVDGTARDGIAGSISSPEPNRPPSRRNRNAHPPSSPPPPRPSHRVTALSNNPADAFASHASSLIASAVLLPLESLCLRSLAHAFLSQPISRPGAAAAALGIRADVRGLGCWFGGGGEGGIKERARYVGIVLLTFGLQGVVSTLVWGLGTGIALSIGRRFGWGQL